ncbi:DUF748 domain-containing protein [Noviherbaspirillum suwonense]|uniref:Uncharacterized protein involved in outer membrane biogenesis n=1 Tax=Noviherbaspirillum suwonense TaxID=1224511 RepID=A0ABY1Q342_9BURK|nr:DUF748 domain-containing protein [Noviherbaspirillum suwonense]SMP53277.1 Uncharacterized protein involved in outer membrane biogenesis [Noviherbaspirillum suwonense]
MSKSISNLRHRFDRIAGSRPMLAVGTVAIAWLAGGLFGVPALLKWQLPQQAQRQLGATLTLGEVYFNPLTLALEVNDISLRTVREGTLLSAGKLRADLEMSGLFRRAWTLADIQLEQPMLRIEYDKQGALNLQPLLSALQKNPAPPDQPPARMLLQRLSIRNGRVDVVDQRLQQPLIARISPVTLDASDIGTLPDAAGKWTLAARSEAGEVLRAGGSLGLQPVALRGTLDLAGVQAGTLARALHRQVTLTDVAGTLGLHGEIDAALAGGALAATLDKVELTLAGLALKSGAAVIAVESGTLALAHAQLAQAEAGLQGRIADISLALGSSSLAQGATRLRFPEARYSSRALLLAPGSDNAYVLEESAMSLPQLALKQAGSDMALSAPAAKAGRLALKPLAGGFSMRADDAALTLAGMTRQEGAQKLRSGAAALDVRSASTRREGSAPLTVRLNAPKVSVAALNVSGARAEPLYGLAEGRGAAESVTLSLPASGPDALVDGLSATLRKLVANDARQPGELAHADSLELKGARLRLASRQLDLGSLTLADGAASVRFASDGSLNWTGPAASPAVASPAAPATTPSSVSTASTASTPPPDKAPVAARRAPAAAPWRITADSIDLRNFSASYADARQQPPLAVDADNIVASVSALDTAGAAPARVALRAGVGGGTLQAQGSLQLQDYGGEFDIKAAGLPLKLAQPYITEAARLVLTGGTLSGAGKLRVGNATGPKITYAGSASLDKVAIDETAPRQPFLSWDAISAANMRLALSPNRLEIGQLNIAGPVGKLIIAEDQTVNLSRVFRKSPAPGAQKTAAASAPAKAADGDPFPVSIARIRVDDGVLTFADFSQQPQFSTRMHDFEGVMTGLSSAPGSRAQMQFNAAIADYGDARISGAMNPFKPAYATDVRMNFRNVDLSQLTPYVVRFAGYRVTAGTLSSDLRYQVKEGRLVGDNRFVLNKVRLGEKVESPTAMDLPLKLALSLLEDENGIINIGVPVTGDLQNPQFSFGAVARRAIGTVLRNIVSAPFRALASLFGGGGEKMDVIAFDPGSAELAPPEQQKLDKLAEALAKRPAVKLLVHPAVSAEQDEAALRSLAARRALLGRMGVKLAADEEPGPVDTAGPDVQKAIVALYRERFPGEAPQPAADVTPEAWHAQLLDKLIAAQPLPQDALAALQKERGSMVREQLVKSSLPESRIALGKPEQATGAQDGDIATRLELVPL